ncbi:MAG TPA: BNR repeat-containing protein [Polyangiaceae bacterium]
MSARCFCGRISVAVLALGVLGACSSPAKSGGNTGGSAGSPMATGGAAGTAQGGAGGAGGTTGVTGGVAGTTVQGGVTGNGGSSGGAPSGGAGGDGTTTGGVSGTSGAGGSSSGAAGSSSGGAGAGGMAGSPAGGKGGAGGGGGAAPTIVEMVDIEDVFSGHPVNFALVTRGNRQFAAYYDTNRNMTVASRTLGSTTWTFKRLPSVLGWDSHNHVSMALDSSNQIHVSGNMHNVPLVYFRSTAAYDASTLAQVASMVGTNEQSVTYPEFFTGPGGNLIFIYRDGGSGNGDHIFDSYSGSSWSRLLGTPLTDGQGARNAYPVGPIQGPDGWFHLVWVWRDSPDASTNHDISYVRSQNLTTWVRGDGSTVTLPITLSTPNVIVDPVPVNGGMINNNTKVGFDAQMRPVVGYHKLDENNYTQLYNARFEGGRWVTHKTTDWTYRWNFGGQGTLVFAIELEGVRVRADGSLVQDYYHVQYGGRGTLRLDPTTLHVVETLPPDTPYPSSLDTPQSSTPMMVVRWAKDSGAGSDPTIKYMLRWETLPSNQDMPRATIPPPTRLRLYGFR